MTLHWWMHWFWVTALLLVHASSVKPFAQTGDLGDLQQITSPPERRARAMYYSKPPAPLNVTTPPTLQHLDTNTTTPNNTVSTTQWTAVLPISTINTTVDDDYLTQTINVVNETAPEAETPNPDLNVTVIPVVQIPNVTINETRKRNVTRQEFVKDESSVRDAPESKIVTEKPLSLETSYLQTRIPPKEVYRRTTTPPSSGLDIGAVSGLALGAVAVGALCASAALVVRRRRDLNPPHALHDKCSNPDSEGYLDDSTVRDNSEEMYSLDNDSFLNSLEAMTIQNYWTDTVKHTKL